MSLKVDAFVGAFGIPRTLEKFYLIVEDFPTTMIRCSECDLPTQEVTVSKMWYAGKAFCIPTAVQETGVINCTLIEDSYLNVAKIITHLQNRWNGDAVWFTQLRIMLMDQITGVIPIQRYSINDAFLEKCSAPQLSWEGSTQVLKYKVTFRYSTSVRSR